MQATGYLGGGGGDDEATSLTGVGGNLVQLTPEAIKDLGSEQIYKVNTLLLFLPALVVLYGRPEGRPFIKLHLALAYRPRLTILS